MFNFNIKKAAIYGAIKKEKIFVFRFYRALGGLSLFIFLIFFLAFLYGFFPQKLSIETTRLSLGVSIIFFILFLFFKICRSFFEQKIKNPPPKNKIGDALDEPGKFNLADFLSFDALKAAYSAARFTRYSLVDSCHLFYFLLRENFDLDFVFLRGLLNVKDVKKTLREEMSKQKSEGGELAFTQSFQSVILDSLRSAQKRNKERATKADVLAALAKNDATFKRILINVKLKAKDIENMSFWMENMEATIQKQKKFWEYGRLAKNGTLAKTWMSGYTLTLDKFSIDLTELVRGEGSEYILRQEEEKIAERILSRREINNVLIVGDSGSSRKSLIYGLAQKSFLGKSMQEVNYKRVVELDMPALVAQLKDSEQIEAVLKQILDEAVSAGNIILVINDFHNYAGQAARPGVIDISGIVTPYLRLPHFQIICITTYEGLHSSLEKNSALLSLFEKVEVSVVTLEQALLILESLAPTLEKKHKIFISYPALRDIVDLADRYQPNLTFPEKAINMLDEAVVYAAAKKNKIVLPEHIAKLITEKTDIPVGDMDAKEKNVLLNLEGLIHQRIINQDEAVSDVSTAMRRTRSNVTIKKGPIGTFLFLGPTGVGKTETSKALAEFYFGSEKRMIRLDMSEFQDAKDIPRLIGSQAEAGQSGFLVNQVRETPFSLLLLDEIEKAHPNILNLFLQVLDEGFLTDGFGRKVDFKNTIIIATSNAGYQIILEAIKQKSEWPGVKQKLLDYFFSENVFRPEFINRFDAVVVFKPLTKENLLNIAQLLLSDLKEKLEDKGIGLVITEPLKEKIAELGYNPIFGAREMRRVIQDKVENALAPALISGKLKRGEVVEINPKDFSLIINPTK